MSSDQDWSVDDDLDDEVAVDPDSTAEGMPRPDLSGLDLDPLPDGGDWDADPADPADRRGGGEPTAAYVLPEIVPATEDPPPTQRVPVTPGPTTQSPTVAAPAAAPVTPTPTPAPASTTAWHQHMPAVTAPPSQLRTPGRRPRVRRVTRVVRHVDPWSVFKIGLIFSLVAYVVCLSAGVLLWRVAEATGTIDNVERWFTQFGWETFEFKGDEIFHNAWIIGLFAVVALTGGLVLLATLFNLVSDIVGGIRVTVLEEEVVERTVSSARRYQIRRPSATTHAGAAADPGWHVDDEPDSAPATSSAARPTTDAAWSVDD